MRLLLTIVLILSPLAVFGQLRGPLFENFFSIRQNTISNIEAFGDTLWIGPSFNYNIGGTNEWLVAENADSVVNGRMSNFSFALGRDTIISGLGYFDDLAGESVPTGGGLYISTMGLDTWTYIPAPLDEQGAVTRQSGGQEFPGYYEYPYGSDTLFALAVTVPQQSVPYDVDFHGNSIFLAGWASGLRRSLDFGQTWESILLPPFEIDTLRPDREYDFVYQPTPPRNTDTDNPNSNLAWTNFLGFSVMVDDQGWVWAGTAGGLNISPNALSAPSDSVIWYHSRAGTNADHLPGNWIITIEQQPETGAIWMTNWIGQNAFGEEQFGISVTFDRGQTFQRHLLGERIYDFGFQGNMVYAVGDNGVFITCDNGQSWRQIRQIRSGNTSIKPGAQYQSAAATNSAIWIGTTDGLASSYNGGTSWSITRVNFPLRRGNQFDEGRDVPTYAYPNPFSPRQHGVVRFAFMGEGGANATLTILDFGMNRVRQISGVIALAESGFSSNSYRFEFEWDGLDDNGRKVANGVYFYVIEDRDRTYKGKVVVAE